MSDVLYTIHVIIHIEMGSKSTWCGRARLLAWFRGWLAGLLRSCGSSGKLSSVVSEKRKEMREQAGMLQDIYQFNVRMYMALHEHRYEEMKTVISFPESLVISKQQRSQCCWRLHCCSGKQWLPFSAYYYRSERLKVAIRQSPFSQKKKIVRIGPFEG